MRWIVLMTVALAACHTPPPAVLGPVMRYDWGGDIDEQRRVTEPSGLVYHPTRRTLFVVGDEGDLAEMSVAGELLRQRRLMPGADFEAITCDPASGLLYVAIEGEEVILEVEPEAWAIRRRFIVPRTWRGRTVMHRRGNGIEAMTFVPDTAHTEGGTLFIANQSFKLHDDADASALIELTLPLRTTAGDGKATLIAYHRMPIIDLAALHYDADRDVLYTISDAQNMLLEVSRTGVIRGAWAMPGANQEGLCVDPSGRMYIAQDTGGIVTLRWRRAAPSTH